MHNMEDGVGSGDGSSDVIKKKSSSGCLIIKKKGNGVLGFGGSSSKKVFESWNEKKRSRLVDADSGSSDELVEPVRRKVREDIIYERRKSGIELEDARMAGFGSERKRSGLDVFEFDEYDGFDGKKMRMDYWDDRLKGAGRSGNYRDFGVGASRNVVHRSEDSERKGSMSGVKSKGVHYSGKGRYEAEEEDDEDDESHLPISFLKKKCREASSDRIRLQGKNGVLKVMVKKKKQGFPDKGSDYPRAEDRMGSRSEAAVKKNEVIRPAFYSDSKRPGKPVSLKTEKSYKKLGNALPVLSSKADSETDDSEKSMEQESMSKHTQRSKKAIKVEHKKATNEQKKITPAEISTPHSGGKESKVTRGNGTEKQLLREKIRSMLLERGWRIDYRPRRNRDYLDAVYINPAGTAYWSIIKAYDALQKQLEEEEDKIKPCGESTSSTALPEEIISKLTRQTRKKIERDLKKKKRDAGCNRSAKEVTMRESANGTDSDQQEEKVSSYMKQSNKSLKGRLHEADHVDENDSSDGLYKRKAMQDMAEKESATNPHMIQGRKSKKIGRCTLLARSSDNGLNSGSDGYVPCTGKRTLLSWLIDSGIVHMSEKVQYMNRRKTKVMLEGWVTKDGIHCGCCSKILTVSKFEIHAGSKQRQPFPNMYLESGLSLMQCQLDAWNKQEESEREGFHNVDVDGDDPNDDTCGLCGDGGDLICCDGCPSTFHQSCLDIKILPAGDWHCPNCTCRFCGFAGCSNDKTDNPLLQCSLCEKKYHQSCSQDEVDLSVDSGGAANSFCGKNCQEIFSHLQKLLGVKLELESGFSWSLVHQMDPASEASHLGFPQRIECNSKLAVALSVMNECFLPIVDRRSGINLIHKVLYNCGSNFSRLNYSGFYTAILERGDEIMSVASIRIHGNQLAEMPFIGTRHIYRRQGMCRRLLSAIKSALRTLKVEKLIIPAIAEHMQTWTKNFKFSPLKESHKQEMRSMNMLVFPRTDMLQKLLVKREIMEGSTSNNSGSPSTELKENCLLLPVLGEKSELDSSPEHDTHMSDNTELQPSTESSNKVTALISASETPTLVTNEIPVICSSLASSFEPKDKKSVLDLSPEHDDTHMSDNTKLLPLTESSDKATALVSASETPTLASNDIPAVSTSLASSCEPKHEPAMAETPPINSIQDNNLAELKPLTESSDKASVLNFASDTPALASNDIPAMSSSLVSSFEHKHDPAMGEAPPINLLSDNNLAELQPLTGSSDKFTVLISASETPTPASNDIPVISSSLVSSCEPKHEPALGETLAINPLSDNLAESIVDLKSSPCNENPSTTAADNAVLGSSLKDHSQSSANDVVTDVLEMNAKAASVKPADDSSRGTSAANIEEDATAIQNFLFVNNYVSCDKSESKHVDSDMNNYPAVDLGNTCEVNVDETLSNPPKKAVEELSEMETVDVDTSRGTSVGSEEDAIAIQDPVYVHDSVSRGTCESLHNGSGMGKDTAVDLDNTCEVEVNDTSVNSPKDSVEHLTTMNTVDEDLAENGSFTLCKGGNVVNNTHAVHEKVACVEPVANSFNKAVVHNNTSEAIGEGPAESSSVIVVVGDERNGDLINSEKRDELGDAQEVKVEVAPVERTVDSVCDTSTENNTCQALDESSKDVKSDSVDRSLVDIESDLHVTTEVASNTNH